MLVGKLDPAAAPSITLANRSACRRSKAWRSRAMPSQRLIRLLPRTAARRCHLRLSPGGGPNR
jgi:hypothetical protein